MNTYRVRLKEYYCFDVKADSKKEAEEIARKDLIANKETNASDIGYEFEITETWMD